MFSPSAVSIITANPVFLPSDARESRDCSRGKKLNVSVHFVNAGGLTHHCSREPKVVVAHCARVMSRGNKGESKVPYSDRFDSNRIVGPRIR